MNVALGIKDDKNPIKSGYANYISQELKQLLMDAGHGACVYRAKESQDLLEYVDKEIPKTEAAWGIEFDTIVLVSVNDSSDDKKLSVVSRFECAELTDGLDYEIDQITDDNSDDDTFRLHFAQNSFEGISFISSDIEDLMPELIQKVLDVTE